MDYNFRICLIIVLVSFVNNMRCGIQNRYRHKMLNDGRMEWVNSCGIDLSSAPQRNRTTSLRPLRQAFPNFIRRLSGMTAIDTSDISEWFKYNSTYSFLPRINASIAALDLAKRHGETQKYVGAFQYLFQKHNISDHFHNNSITFEINSYLNLAKNLLCEIEKAINVTGRSIPVFFLP